MNNISGIVSCIFSGNKIDVYALFFSWFAIFCATKRNKIENLIKLSGEIANMKQQVLTAYSKWRNNSNESTEYVLKECVTEYANVFEIACYFYSKKRIKKSDFKQLYFDEIDNLFNGGGFGEFLVIQEEQSDAYKYVKAFIKECKSCS